MLGAALRAYPEAVAVHVIRDGRDVVTSLLERGWLSAERTGADDARLAFGAHARFWVEPGREAEFERVSDATARGVGVAQVRHGGCARCPSARSSSGTSSSSPNRGARRSPSPSGSASQSSPSRRRSPAVHDRSAGRWRRRPDAASSWRTSRARPARRSSRSATSSAGRGSGRNDAAPLELVEHERDGLRRARARPCRRRPRRRRAPRTGRRPR